MFILRGLIALVLVTSVVIAGSESQPRNPVAQPTSVATPTPSPPPKKVSWFDWMLRFTGITLTTGNQKGQIEREAGTVWIADLITGDTEAVTQTANFRSPVFLSSGRGILALRDSDVVRFSLKGKDLQTVSKVSGILKLVGTSLDDPDMVLVVIHDEKTDVSRLAVLSVKTGQVSMPDVVNKSVEGDPKGRSEADLALTIASGAERENGILKVYVETMKQGEKVWTDVFLIIKKDGPVTAPRNVSECNGVSCMQPSVSAEGRYVAFIKRPG
jgi:hypothetical protein